MDDSRQGGYGALQCLGEAYIDSTRSPWQEMGGILGSCSYLSYLAPDRHMTAGESASKQTPMNKKILHSYNKSSSATL